MVLKLWPPAKAQVACWADLQSFWFMTLWQSPVICISNVDAAGWGPSFDSHCPRSMGSLTGGLSESLGSYSKLCIPEPNTWEPGWVVLGRHWGFVHFYSLPHNFDKHLSCELFFHVAFIRTGLWYRRLTALWLFICKITAGQRTAPSVWCNFVVLLLIFSFL